MTSFLSTFVNKVDRKGRVSVPAPFRAALADQSYQGIIAYPSLSDPAIDAFGRDMLERLSRQSVERTMDDGDFERVLLGGARDDVVETVMAMACELPFDGEGRIVLPGALTEAAGVTDRAAFVGRGARFQIWAPDSLETHQQQALGRLRERLGPRGGDRS